jgi:hypothetical protein
MLPYSLTLSVMSAMAGYLLGPLGGYRLIVWASWVCIFSPSISCITYEIGLWSFRQSARLDTVS